MGIWTMPVGGFLLDAEGQLEVQRLVVGLGHGLRSTTPLEWQRGQRLRAREHENSGYRYICHITASTTAQESRSRDDYDYNGLLRKTRVGRGTEGRSHAVTRMKHGDGGGRGDERR